jgi:acyl carrier protein
MKDDELTALFTRGIAQVAPDKSAVVGEISLEGRISDLGLDSIATMELVAYIEEQVGRRFHDDDIARVVTFADLTELIRKP